LFGVYLGEFVLDVARIGAAVSMAWQRANWFAYRSSSPLVSWLTWGRGWSGMGDPGAVVLFGLHVTERLAQIGQHRGYGVVLIVVRDRVLKLAAVAAQLERGERVQAVVRLVDGWRLA
jgi:hypothetical protein